MMKSYIEFGIVMQKAGFLKTLSNIETLLAAKYTSNPNTTLPQSQSPEAILSLYTHLSSLPRLAAHPPSIFPLWSFFFGSEHKDLADT